MNWYRCDPRDCGADNDVWLVDETDDHEAFSVFPAGGLWNYIAWNDEGSRGKYGGDGYESAQLAMEAADNAMVLHRSQETFR